MIRYHGGPITPESAALAAWKRSHAMISFANPQQTELAFAVADSVALDSDIPSDCVRSTWGYLA